MNDTGKLYANVDPTVYDITTLTADAVFKSIAEMQRGKAVLKAHGFSFPISDHFHDIDDVLWAVTVTTHHAADMSVDEFSRLITRLLAPFDAMLFEYGLVVLDEEAAWRDGDPRCCARGSHDD